jgi:hypothetical protein
MKKRVKQNKVKELTKESLKKATGGGLTGPDEPGIIREIIPITTQEC